jgi:predicted patatin/cPLA2 family phospholipase
VLIETFTQASSKEQKVTKNTVLKIVAVDNEGGKASRTLTLYYRNILPTLNVTTTNPVKNYYEVNIDAQDANGQVVKYEIYENNVLVSTTTEKPTYTPTLTKNLYVTIIVTDNE